MTTQLNINPAQWNQALGLARQACAEVFKKGGGPTDAIRAHGLSSHATQPLNWGKAIPLIALAFCGAFDPRARQIT